MKRSIARAGIVGVTVGAFGCGDPRVQPPHAAPSPARRAASAWKNYLDPLELHRAWVPPSASPWRPYYKPTLCASAALVEDAVAPGPEDARMRAALEAFVARVEFEKDAAVVVDLYHEASVTWAAALAKRGLVPVLTVNNWPHSAGFIPLERTLGGLIRHAADRAAAPSDAHARPVFILDRGRLNAKGQEAPSTRLDNRYFHTPSDFPTAEALKKEGVRRVIYVNPRGRTAGSEEDDLSALFASWHRGGLEFTYVHVKPEGEIDPLPVIVPERPTVFHPGTLTSYAAARPSPTYHSPYAPLILWNSRPGAGTWGTPSGGGSRSFSS
jgi:hypothetical protein